MAQTSSRARASRSQGRGSCPLHSNNLAYSSSPKGFTVAGVRMGDPCSPPPQPPQAKASWQGSSDGSGEEQRDSQEFNWDWIKYPKEVREKCWGGGKRGGCPAQPGELIPSHPEALGGEAGGLRAWLAWECCFDPCPGHPLGAEVHRWGICCLDPLHMGTSRDTGQCHRGPIPEILACKDCPGRVITL